LATVAKALMVHGVPPRGGRLRSPLDPACIGGCGHGLTLLAQRPHGSGAARRVVGPLCVSGIDAAPAPHYLTPMRGLLRTVLLALTLALAAGTVLHTARAAAMDLAMAAAPSADTRMPGCDGCDDGGDDPGSAMASCAALCAVPPMAPPAGPHS